MQSRPVQSIQHCSLLFASIWSTSVQDALFYLPYILWSCFVSFLESLLPCVQILLNHISTSLKSYLKSLYYSSFFTLVHVCFFLISYHILRSVQFSNQCYFFYAIYYYFPMPFIYYYYCYYYRSSCLVWAFSGCGVWVSLVAVCGLSCPVACGLSAPRPGIEPTSPALDGEFLTTRPPRESCLCCFNKEQVLWSQGQHLLHLFISHVTTDTIAYHFVYYILKDNLFFSTY